MAAILCVVPTEWEFRALESAYMDAEETAMLSGCKLLPSDCRISFMLASDNAIRVAAGVGAELYRDLDISLILRVGCCVGVAPAELLGSVFVGSYYRDILGLGVSPTVLPIGDGHPAAAAVLGSLDFPAIWYLRRLLALQSVENSYLVGSGLHVLYDSVLPGIAAAVGHSGSDIGYGLCCVLGRDVSVSCTLSDLESSVSEKCPNWAAVNVSALLELVHTHLLCRS